MMESFFGRRARNPPALSAETPLLRPDCQARCRQLLRSKERRRDEESEESEGLEDNDDKKEEDDEEEEEEAIISRVLIIFIYLFH